MNFIVCTHPVCSRHVLFFGKFNADDNMIRAWLLCVAQATLPRDAPGPGTRAQPSLGEVYEELRLRNLKRRAIRAEEMRSQLQLQGARRGAARPAGAGTEVRNASGAGAVPASRSSLLEARSSARLRRPNTRSSHREAYSGSTRKSCYAAYA